MMRGVVLIAVLAGVTAGCSATHQPAATLEIDYPDALADRPIQIRVSGLDAGETTIVRSSAKDYKGAQWHAEATFKADGAGAVDIARTAPLAGSYQGADPMGLFWSMQPPTGDPDSTAYGLDEPWLKTAFDVHLSVIVNGREAGTRDVRRVWTAAGVTHRTLTVAKDGVAGELFLPAPGGPSHPGVLAFGGSEGGIATSFDAALLASHGYPTLALGYFAKPGLPPTLHNIPLEYFAAAARVLSPQPVVVYGYSRGTEAALLLAQYYPRLVRATVLYSPNDEVWGAYPGTGDAWTNHGTALPKTTIPVTDVTGPVLAIAGDRDRLWASAPQAERIMQHLDSAQAAVPHQALIYTDAGHGVGTYPYQPAGTRLVNPITGTTLLFGGTRAGDAAARSDGWPKVLAWLGALTTQ